MLSDTHSYLDEPILKFCRDADEIWHAGDWGADVDEKLIKLNIPVRGVYGNIDGAKIRTELPLDLRFDCEGLPIFMTHIGGYPGRYEPRVGKILKENPPTNGIFISGHSHILKVMPDKNLGFLHINPGACGNEGWHKVKTLVRFSIEKARIFDLQVIELGSRGIKGSVNYEV